MESPATSLVIVSRDRPDSLLWCLAAVDGLDHAKFEVIVVACPAGVAAVERAGLAGRVRLLGYDEANIAAARNIGIAAAAGEIVAFLDDDAAPEPTWLRRLVAPFAAAEVAAAGGFVRGRNGISFQWKARQVDGCAREEPLTLDKTRVFQQSPGRAIKTEGTNMAFRRAVLAQLGGFDPQFRFYLDETDLNLRLAAEGHAAALVPGAEVHHAYAASARRKADRAVTDLSEIGASITYFLRKHCRGDADTGRLEKLLRDQQLRVMDQLRRGLLQRRDVAPLMKGLNDGVQAGRAREITAGAPIETARAERFLRFVPQRRSGGVLAGRIWQAGRLRAEARARAAAGETVSLFLFGPSPRKHRVRFDAAGFWEQSGGLFGRAERDEPVVRLMRFSTRLKRECARVAPQRGLDRSCTH